MAENRSLLNLPKGVFYLAFTEMWERFAFYSMRALLVLFLVDSQSGGMGWDRSEALTLYGWYNFIMYLMSIPGGILADKWIGQKNAVRLGGFLIIIGAGLLSLGIDTAFFAGLGFMIFGVGALKPNISTMVGGLFNEGDDRRDAAFSIFYMGINFGAMIAGVAAGVVASVYGWNYGFGLSAIGMIIGQLVFWIGRDSLKDVGNSVKNAAASTIDAVKQPFAKESTDSRTPFTKMEKDRIILLFISFFIVMVFWGAFEQAGGLLNIYANDKTDRILFNWEIPAAVFQSLNAAFIMIFAIPVAAFWAWAATKFPNLSAVFKMGVGTAILGVGYLFMVGAVNDYLALGSSSMMWLVGIYLLATIGELSLSPVALSYITKVAPKRIVASVMGIYFAVTGLGNLLAAEIGKLTESYSEHTIFYGLVIFCVGFGGLLMLFSKQITKLAHGIKN